MKVVVLGCGPAGLMAAHAAATAGAEYIAVVSRKQKSPLYGCQYLHRPIPDVTPGDSRPVSYTLRGDVDDYRRKVYGAMTLTTSPEDLVGDHEAWDIRITYDRLWKQWEPAITDAELDPRALVKTLDDLSPDLVVNSLPRDAICYGGHQFGFTEVWAAGDAPELGIHIPYQCPNEMVICNAEDNPAWYRMSRVFGRTTVEWPGIIGRVPVDTAARVRKPTNHDCDCWPTLHHVGRYGRWEKGVLSHDAYFSTLNYINEKIGAGSGQAAEAEA